MEKRKKWSEVYPQGTKEGNEEQYLFIGKNRSSGLARHPKYDWRSVDALVKESGLPQARVEEILKKYVKMGLVIQNPKNADNWGYWERDAVKSVLTKINHKSISDTDKSSRINNHLDEDDD